MLIGPIGSALVNFSTAFVFSPKAWAGFIMFGIAALIFLVAGRIPLLSSRRRRAQKKEEQARAQANANANGRAPAPAGKGGMAAALPRPANARKGGTSAREVDGLYKDVEEILRRRGIK